MKRTRPDFCRAWNALLPPPGVAESCEFNVRRPEVIKIENGIRIGRWNEIIKLIKFATFVSFQVLAQCERHDISEGRMPRSYFARIDLFCFSARFLAVSLLVAIQPAQAGNFSGCNTKRCAANGD